MTCLINYYARLVIVRQMFRILYIKVIVPHCIAYFYKFQNVWGYLCLAVMIVSICSCFYQNASFKLVDNNKNDVYSMEQQSNTLCQITQEFINWFELVFTALIQKGTAGFLCVCMCYSHNCTYCYFFM